MKPQFIVIEGIEGAGKSTIIDYIANLLNNNNINYILTREPGGTTLAEKIRELFKEKLNDETVYPETEVLLLYAARLQLVNNIIKPALANNTWVIGDRHDFSTIAYQCGGRGISEHFIKNIKQEVLGDFSFDYCLYLDVTPEVGLKRAESRGQLDRIEQENIDFFAKIREKYLSLINNCKNTVLINSEQDLSLVKQQVFNFFEAQYNFSDI